MADIRVLVVDDDNTIRTRNIKVGRNIGPLWAVSAGLEAGDRLVVEGLQNLREGAAIEQLSEQPAADPL